MAPFTVDVIVEQTTGKAGGRTVIIILIDGKPQFGGPMADLFRGLFDRCLEPKDCVPCGYEDEVFNGNSRVRTE